MDKAVRPKGYLTSSSETIHEMLVESDSDESPGETQETLSDSEGSQMSSLEANISGTKPPILPKPKVIPSERRRPPRQVKDVLSPLEKPLPAQSIPADVEPSSVNSHSHLGNSFNDFYQIGTGSVFPDEFESNPNCDQETNKDEVGSLCETVSHLLQLEYQATLAAEKYKAKSQWDDESSQDAWEKSDSDGVSLTSLKSLDANSSCNPQDNTTFSDSFDTFNASDLQNGFNSELNNHVSGEKAFLIAKEFMTSEQVYVKALRLIIYTFKDHLDSCSPYTAIIPPAQFYNLISSMPQLLKLSEALLEDLENRINTWSTNPQFADVIVKKGPFLKLYSLYMKNFDAQGTALEELCIKYPKFARALYEFESFEVCKKLTVRHYMLKPVQRIPQYRLLLERYISHLEDDSEEYANATSALTIVKNVLEHANSTIKSSDNLSTLLKLQSRLGNYEIIKPGRTFIKEGELQKLSRKEIQPRYFILLSDCLLYTIYSTSSTYLRMKYELPLAGMRVYRHEETEFDIITSTRSCTLRARNEEECSQWMTALQSAIMENNQKQRSFFTMQNMTNSIYSDSLKLGKEAPVWIQDKRTTMCQICTAEFKVTFRRHHCRCCGRVVCSVCSNNRAPLQYLKFHHKRVCDECYDYLLKEFEDPVSDIISCIRRELGLDDSEATSMYQEIKASFKKFDGSRKPHKIVPQRLKEVTANDSGSQMSGWLETKGKRGWKRLWFVLKDQVLYYYKASHDVMAYQTLPVLGYSVEQPQEPVDGLDKSALFVLAHEGQPPQIFLASSEQAAKMWISALSNATVLY